MLPGSISGNECETVSAAEYVLRQAIHPRTRSAVVRLSPRGPLFWTSLSRRSLSDRPAKGAESYIQ